MRPAFASRLALLALTMFCAAPALRAQTSVVATSTGGLTAPRREAAVAGLRASETGATLSLEAVNAITGKTTDRTRGRTYMIVGGAAFLAGLIIGNGAGTAMAVGGAIIGIYGLYLYLP